MKLPLFYSSLENSVFSFLSFRINWNLLDIYSAHARSRERLQKFTLLTRERERDLWVMQRSALMVISSSPAANRNNSQNQQKWKTLTNCRRMILIWCQKEVKKEEKKFPALVTKRRRRAPGGLPSSSMSWVWEKFVWGNEEEKNDIHLAAAVEWEGKMFWKKCLLQTTEAKEEANERTKTKESSSSQKTKQWNEGTKKKWAMTMIKIFHSATMFVLSSTDADAMILGEKRLETSKLSRVDSSLILAYFVRDIFTE